MFMCNVKVTPAERIGYVCFARYSVEYLVLLTSVVPCPMSSNDVIEWLVFACALDDGMF